MKRTIIIFALIGITISAATMAMAQNKGRTHARQRVHVNGQSGNDQISTHQNRPSRGVDRDTNHDGRRSINWGDGKPGVRRASSVTFEGNDEPLWAKAQRRSGNVSNVGPQINGNVRPKGFANTTLDDQAARSSQSVQGNQIGTDLRPRRTGLSGDFNGDGQVDGADYLMRTSAPAGGRSGITGGDFNTDGPTTVGRSSMNGAARPQSLSAGTYGRGNRR
jgi:hypothetical protein